MLHITPNFFNKDQKVEIALNEAYVEQLDPTDKNYQRGKKYEIGT